MARPRIFVSSTYYDLKYLRSSLENFIESLGYDAILSEKGQIAYSHDVPLDESCYREVTNCDVYVLIVGGRYGSETSQEKSRLKSSGNRDGFFERYESITKQEYKAAVEADIPIYVLIDRSVYSEFHTFQRNRENGEVKYAHVDSVNIFHFIDDILSQPRNNPIQQFDKDSDIESWLREQWAGLFRELLHRQSGQRQIASLAAQVEALGEVNTTLRRYLEEVVSKVAPDSAAGLIHEEKKRLDEAMLEKVIKGKPVIAYLTKTLGFDLDALTKLIRQSKDSDTLIQAFDEAASRLKDKDGSDSKRWEEIRGADYFKRDLNEIRQLLGSPWLWPDLGPREAKEGRARSKTKRTEG